MEIRIIITIIIKGTGIEIMPIRMEMVAGVVTEEVMDQEEVYIWDKTLE